jgi:hypothetical protein
MAGGITPLEESHESRLRIHDMVMLALGKKPNRLEMSILWVSASEVPDWQDVWTIRGPISKTQIPSSR